MRLTEWQQRKSLVKAAMALKEDETFSLLLEMLEEESPLNLPLSQQGPTGDDRSYRLGLIEGYTKCLRTMRATWITPKLSIADIKATYKPSEE